MAREHENSAQSWGSSEELLLACAVNRHGTKSWDSIAMELQSRRSSSLPSLTPQNCRDKFNDLKRRFMAQNAVESASLVRMVEELRRIRVEELRREVQRRDVSIVSLELKVKRLEEEREKSLKEEADLERDGLKGKDKKFSPVFVAGTPVAGDESDERDDRSFNESNSTSHKPEKVTITKDGRNDAVDTQQAQVKFEPNCGNESDRTRTGSEVDRDRDWSSNANVGSDHEGRSEGKGKQAEREEKEDAEATLAGRLGVSKELRESVCESKRDEGKEGAASKQSSDMQSSASLSRKRRCRGGGAGGGAAGSSSCEEPEGDEVSPATKRISAVKPEPLVKFLGIIRSHRLSSWFQRRVRNQESERYKNLIRQHMDLQTIQSRLDKGVYSDCTQNFFRDLLLLFNNAIVFYRKSSAEHRAAQQLRTLVLKEVNVKLRKPEKPISLKSEPYQPPIPRPKPGRSSSMALHGKRTSLRAISDIAGKRGDKKEGEANAKPEVDASFTRGGQEKGTRKKRSTDKKVSTRRNTRSSNKTVEVKHEYGNNELSSHDAVEIKLVRKESSGRKKQSAAGFLKRMTQNSSPSETTDNVDEDIVSEDNESNKDSKGEGEEEEEEEQEEEKKKKNTRGRKRTNGQREKVSRGGGREESARGRRGVGRPPKRAAAVESSGKGGRDNGEKENGGRLRKRARR